MSITILSLRFRAAVVLVLAVVFGSQLSRSVFPQPATQTQNQIRTVEGQVLTSPYLPAIRIRFDSKFNYVGKQRFVLYERAQAEQFFFVAADNRGRIQRMYLVQFEGYLPGVDAAYDYPATQTVTLAGQTYLVNAEAVSNVSDVIKQDPQSDMARAAAFLQSKGLHISNSIRFQRFVRLVDDAKRNELLLIYVEDATTPAAQDKLGKEFLARAMQGFTIL